MNPHDDEGAEIELVTKRHGTWIPDWVILAKRLSDREFRVYSILRMHCGKDRRVFPGQKTIAEMLGGAKLDSVGKAIAKLRDLGLLRIEVERHQAGRRNVYYLYEDPPEGYEDGPTSRSEFYAQRGVTPQTGVTPRRGDIPPKMGGGDPPNGGDGSPPKRGSEVKQVEVSKEGSFKPLVTAGASTDRDDVERDLFGEHPVSSKTGVSDPKSRSKTELDDLWLEFWKVYPLKKAKIAARKSWDVAVRNADPREIINAAIRYAQELETSRRQAYTKHPATWLNGGCWEDEPEPAHPPGINGNGYTPYKQTASGEDYVRSAATGAIFR